VPKIKRSYRVDFRHFAELAPDFQPCVTPTEAIDELRDRLLTEQFKDSSFRQSKFIRLRVLKALHEAGRIDDLLFWRDKT